MTAPFTAIETTYAGCRFRSRLEARWAVFFNTLGIRWEYEPQGFASAAGAYLPDFCIEIPYRSVFWDDVSHVHVEVKGSDEQVSDADRERMAALIQGNGPLRTGLVLLGPIPRVDRATEVLHCVVERVEGDTLFSSGAKFARTIDGWALASYFGAYDAFSGKDDGWPADASWAAQVLRVELPNDGKAWRIDPDLAAAYDTARSSRFEHGETPLRHVDDGDGDFWPAGTRETATTLDELFGVGVPVSPAKAISALRDVGLGRKIEVVRAALRWRMQHGEMP